MVSADANDFEDSFYDDGIYTEYCDIKSHYNNGVWLPFLSGSSGVYFVAEFEEGEYLEMNFAETPLTLQLCNEEAVHTGEIVRTNKTKSWKKIKTTTATSYKVQKLTAGTKYKFRVKAYKKDDGTIWGAASSTFETATKCKTPTLKVTSTKKGVAALTWTNVNGESAYQVYYSTSKNGTYKKLATTKANVAKYSKKKLKSKKTYYFKVRAVTKTASGNVYSAWSSVKSVKIK